MRSSVMGVVLIAAVGLIFAWCDGEPQRARAGGDSELTFSKARIYIEFNDTDQDVGVQVFLDGEPWRSLQAYRPDGKRILSLTSLRGLRLQGLSEFFFESSEPSLAEVSLAEFLCRFPAGTYEFEGVTTGGEEIEGEATLSHLIPRGPEILSPASDEDEPPVVDPVEFEIEWAAVTETVLGDPSHLNIVKYQVIVEDGNTGNKFDILLPGTASSVKVPDNFLSGPGLHKVEILAVDATGNQSISEVEFVTE